MTLNRLKVAALVAGSIILTASVASAAPNAADSYREAFEWLEDIATDPDNVQLAQPNNTPLNSKTGSFLARYAKATELVRLAGSIPDCDWGERTIQDRLDEQSKVVTIFRLTLLDARYAVQRKDSQRFVDDTLATMTFIRQRGRKGRIVDKVVEVTFEGRAIEVLAASLAGLPPELIKQLPQRLDALPKPETGVELMATEYAYARTQQGGNFTMAVMISSMDPFYKTIGEAMDVQPPKEFSPTLDQEMSKNSGNLLLKPLAPTLKRIREQMAVIETRRVMLGVAINVLINGEAVVASSHDPYGAGPFTYVKTADGFVLTSQLSDRAGPVKLTVGK